MRLSFIQPDTIFDKLAEYQTNSYINYPDFRLHIIDDGRKKGSKKEPTKIIANVLVAGSTLLGEFTFNDSAKYEGLCFFRFHNHSLYRHENAFGYLDNIAGALSLEYNTLTEIELACDVNLNPVSSIRKLIKNHQDFTMIYVGRKIEDENRKLENYVEFTGRSRAKVDKIPSLAFRQQKKEGLAMRVYDKRKEIKEESQEKSYIEDWNGFKGKHFFRLEIVIKWEEFQKWLAFLNSPQSDCLNEWKQLKENKQDYLAHSVSRLQLTDYKSMLWQYCADRLLYFRNKRTNEVVNLFDIACGWKTYNQSPCGYP